MQFFIVSVQLITSLPYEQVQFDHFIHAPKLVVGHESTTQSVHVHESSAYTSEKLKPKKLINNNMIPIIFFIFYYMN